MKEKVSSTERKNNKNFQHELQEQLNMLPKKEEFSNKKSKVNIIFNKESFMNFQQKNMMPNEGASIFQISSLTDNQNSLSPNSIIKQNKNIHETKDKKVNKQSIFDIISKQQMRNCLQKYFTGRQQIQISQFIEMILLQYFPQEKLSKEYIKQFEHFVRPDLSTTNQKILSFNALQILLKKTNIREYFLQILLKIKYRRKKKQLEKDYNQIFNQLMIQKKEIQKRQGLVIEIEAELKIKADELSKKQKNIVNKQKDFTNKEKQLLLRQKNFKKYLQERHQKLMQNFMTQLQKESKQIDKKIVSFERNARNKLELIQKRANQYKLILKTKSQVQSSTAQKKDQQVISLRLKLKKIQKQFQILKGQSSQQIKNIQKESNSLLKANTILQSKIDKLKQKNKILNEELQKKDQEISLLKNTIQIKNQQILHFQRNDKQALFQKDSDSQFSQKQNSSSNSKTHNKTDQLKSSRKKHIFAEKQNKKSKRNNASKLKFTKKELDKNQMHEQQFFKDQLQTIVKSFNNLFSILILRFQNSNTKSSQQYQISKEKLKIEKQVSLEQILINDTQNILQAGIKIISGCLKFQILDIDHIVKFLFKMYLAKCSYLRFQQINQILVKDHKYIENFIQKIRHFGLKFISYQFFQDYANGFIKKYQEYHVNSQISKIRKQFTYIELILLLSMIGCNEVYDENKGKSVSLISIVKNCIDIQIDKIQQFGFKSSQQNLNLFQQCELITYLLANFLQNHQTCEIFLQIILSICNLYSSSTSSHNKEKDFLLFKSICQLQNYKYLLKCMLGFQSNEQIIEKSSIILQRFFYNFAQTIHIDEEDVQQIKKLKLKVQKQNSNSLITANLASIIQSLE